MSPTALDTPFACLASAWHLISCDGTANRTTTLTNIAHFSEILSSKQTWEVMKTASKTAIDQASFRMTKEERIATTDENKTNNKVRQERGLRAFRNMIKVGKAFDPLMDLWYDLEAGEDLSHIDEEDISHLPKWFEEHRQYHQSQVPKIVLEHLASAYALYKRAGPTSIVEQASIVMLAHSIWEESSWEDHLRLAEERLALRPAVEPEQCEGYMGEAMQIMVLVKGVLEQVSKEWAKALDWVECQTGV